MTTKPLSGPQTAEQPPEAPGAPTAPQTPPHGSPETHSGAVTKNAAQSTAFVIMVGGTPTTAATTFDSATADALAAETQYARASEWDYRWDEYLPGQVWRLMQRRKGAAGKGRRFSWTGRAVHTVGFLAGGEGR
ncbi:hypothetical protein [Streptomyces sp. BBFR109]|uniref:hypothetical protein n=1 Tax=Streptomyces sp. BBFR109 TaxID=3448172 RepID=UPI003F75CB1E